MEQKSEFSKNLWQPTLVGEKIMARPLKLSDYDALFTAASDPRIWAGHPVPDRYIKPKFDIYFHTGIASNGALVVADLGTGEVIGTSRFVAHNPKSKTFEIGYTFLKCSHWGNGTNRELKTLMLKYAFQFVEQVEFVVGAENWRSQAAVIKIGGKQVRTVTERVPEGDLRKSIVYLIRRSEFLERES